MKKLILIALGASMAVPAMMAQDSQEGADENIASKYPGFYLAFQEEFDVDGKVDGKKWYFETGMPRNHEAQVYTRKNAVVKDGNLVIEARREKTKNPGYSAGSSDWNKVEYADYSSACIYTRHSSSADYSYGPGIYEIRAKIPVGDGYWPAIWTLGTKYEWPYNGEIDIMEYYKDALHANVAWGTTQRWNARWNSRAPRMSEFDADFADKFHVWKMVWDEDYIRLYVDDRLLNETSLDMTVNPRSEWFPFDGVNPYRGDHKQYILLNLALGGDNGGNVAAAAFPVQYYVDYVRVYQPITEGVAENEYNPGVDRISDVYTLDGIRVSDDIEGLDKGMYIVMTDAGAKKVRL